MESASAYNLNYDVDVRTDYNTEMDKIFTGDPIARALMQEFFDKSVYPGWYRQKQNQ
jgi:hypothetical protein